MKQVFQKLKERKLLGEVVSIPWYNHNEHFTINDKGTGIYFSREAKCPTISPVWINDGKDYQRLKKKFKKIWLQGRRIWPEEGEDKNEGLPNWLNSNTGL